MSILMFVLFGLIIGFLARAVMPGRQSMGFLATALVGMAGSFIGGFLGNIIAGYPLLDMHSSGFIGSLIGALVVLAIMSYAGRRRGLLA